MPVLETVQVNSADEAEKKIREIEDSLTNGTVIKDLIFADSPVKNFYQYWAKQLEVLAKSGRYQKPISTICATITQRVTELGFPEKAAYVRQSLQFKYKDISRVRRQDEDELLETAEELRKISSKKLPPDDKKFLHLLILERRAIEKAITKFSKQPSLSLLTGKVKKNQEEFILRAETMIKKNIQVLDDRNQVPFNQQFLFMHARTQATLGNTYAIYVKHIKEYAKFTTKQAGKIVDGRISNVLLLYEPKNRLEAMDAGFYGMPCDSCGSWRCKAKFNSDQEVKRDMLFCFACQVWSELKTLRLPLSD